MKYYYYIVFVKMAVLPTYSLSFTKPFYMYFNFWYFFDNVFLFLINLSVFNEVLFLFIYLLNLWKILFIFICPQDIFVTPWWILRVSSVTHIFAICCILVLIGPPTCSFAVLSRFKINIVMMSRLHNNVSWVLWIKSNEIKSNLCTRIYQNIVSIMLINHNYDVTSEVYWNYFFPGELEKQNFHNLIAFVKKYRTQ